MANFRSSPKSSSSDKNQPRRLSARDPAQTCSWVACPARAVSEYRAQVYCASHLLKVLQQQWAK